jgi:hypothetical protein
MEMRSRFRASSSIRHRFDDSSESKTKKLASQVEVQMPADHDPPGRRFRFCWSVAVRPWSVHCIVESRDFGCLFTTREEENWVTNTAALRDAQNSLQHKVDSLDCIHSFVGINQERDTYRQPVPTPPLYRRQRSQVHQEQQQSHII